MEPVLLKALCKQFGEDYEKLSDAILSVNRIRSRLKRTRELIHKEVEDHNLKIKDLKKEIDSAQKDCFHPYWDYHNDVNESHMECIVCGKIK